ncbi:MAG: hypothetical protein GYB58_07225 [Gammaproteobacteria bacterium]|nr:hypothetical protein [Gammaproteobacteria bacterium]
MNKAVRKPIRWWRNRYMLNSLLLLLPAYFYYQSLNPTFPTGLAEQQVGPFSIEPFPYDSDGPYQHDGLYVKDFLLMFHQGDLNQIKQAYLNIGEAPLPLAVAQKNELGILHGTRYGQEVHALADKKINQGDKIWLTIERWQGDVLTSQWPVPGYWL